MQFAPPFLGLGLVHSLLLLSAPGPQVLPEVWQGLQELHSVQPPGSEVLGKLSSVGVLASNLNGLFKPEMQRKNLLIFTLANYSFINEIFKDTLLSKNPHVQCHVQKR